MIRLCSRFDSVLFTPKMSAIPSYGNYSRSPYVFLEANPSPMFLRFEEDSGLPLTESLASLLLGE
jgi:hypothetical protein